MIFVQLRGATMQPTGNPAKRQFEFIQEKPEDLGVKARKKNELRQKVSDVTGRIIKCQHCGVDKTPEWRHVKDQTGNIVKNDASGEEIWLCNKHGLEQDRAIRSAKAAQKRNEETTRHEQHVHKKMSVDSLINEGET